MSKSQRSTAEIMMDLLQAITRQRNGHEPEDGIEVTKRSLMRSANVNYQQLGRYLTILEERGFIREIQDNGTLRIAVRRKGQRALETSEPDRVNRALLQAEDQEILEILDDGRNTAANIATETGYNRQYVYNRLRWLVDHGHVRNVGNGVFELAGSAPAQPA